MLPQEDQEMLKLMKRHYKKIVWLNPKMAPGHAPWREAETAVKELFPMYKLTVDGLKMRILVNGAPAAARATFTEFPVLKPGSNSITCDDRVTVQYYPLYF